MKRILLTILTCWMLSQTLAHATIYYVDPVSGLDANNGTSEATAWKTLSKAGTASSGYVAGDTIKFRRGTVVVPDATTGTLTVAASGSAGSPITFGAYTKTGDAAGLADPILDMGNVAITGGWTEQTANGLPGVYYNTYNGSVVNGLFVSRRWITHSATLPGIGTDEFWWNSASNTSHAINASYAVGIYWKPAATDDPATAVTRKASNTQGFLVTNQHHITVEDLQLEGGNRCFYGVSSSAAVNNIIVQRVTFKECRNAATIEGAVGRPTFNITYDSNTVSYSGRGLYVGSGTGTGADTTTGSKWLNNVAHHIDAVRFETLGAAVDEEAFSAQNTVGALFQGNRLYDSPLAYCIVIWSNTASGDISGTTIRRNRCEGGVQGIAIGAAVGSATLGNNRVYANLVTNCTGFGIKVNIAGTRANYVGNNYVNGCDVNFYTQGGGAGANNWNFLNNISLNPLTSHASWGDVSTSFIDFNFYYPDGSTLWAEGGVSGTFAAFKTAVTTNGVTAPDANSTVGTTAPNFVSTTDLRLAPTSTLRRAGRAWPECADFRGQPCVVPKPDIGAYQSGAGDPAKPRRTRTP